MEVPSLLIRLNIEDEDCGPIIENVTCAPVARTVDVELSYEALETMLEGLGRIKDQLSAMG